MESHRSINKNKRDPPPVAPRRSRPSDNQNAVARRPGSTSTVVSGENIPKRIPPPVAPRRSKPSDNQDAGKSLRVWYRHSGQGEIDELPNVDDITYKEVNEAEIAADIGDHHITHLIVEGDLPTFDVIGSHITHLEIQELKDNTQLDRLRELKQLQVLHFKSCNFSRGLPMSVTQLTSLKELRLWQCRLTKLPSELANLKQLQMLYLRDNNFSGGLPLVVTKMTSLNKLMLNRCQLRELSAELRELKQLQVLHFKGCNFSRGLPMSVTQLASLKELILWQCKLTTLPSELANLEQLQELQLNGNDFSGRFPLVVTKMTSLNKLVLEEFELKELPAELRELKHLQVLHFHECNFSSGLPMSVTHLASLKELRLWDCELIKLPSELTNLKQLQALDLGRNNFLGGLPLVVTKMMSLSKLMLRSCKLRELPAKLANLKQLQELDLRDNNFSGGLPLVATKMTSLNILGLVTCGLEELPAEFSNLQELRDLKLSFNEFTELPPPVYKLKKLQTLDISYNNQLTRIDKKILQLTNLTELDCYGCYSLTHPPEAVCSQGLHAVRKYFTDLEQSEKIRWSSVPVTVAGTPLSVGEVLPAETPLDETNTTSAVSGTSTAAQAPQPSLQSVDDDSDLSDSMDYLDECNETLDNISLRINVVTRPDIKQLFASEKVYRMSVPTRGRCLIINNREFDEPTASDQVVFSERPGSEVDVRNLKRAFRQLSFELDAVYSDLFSQDMLRVIKEETQRTEHDNYGMFVLVIMTHGNEAQLYGSDGRAVNLSTVYDLMSPYNFKRMAGKPKWLIIQACSGERRDTMGAYSMDSSSSPAVQPAPSPSTQDTTDGPEPFVHLATDDMFISRASFHKRRDTMGGYSMDSPDPPAVQPAPSPSTQDTTDGPEPFVHLATDDMFITRPSFHSYVSTRHPRNGTWFVRALVEALLKHSNHRDVQTLFEKQVKKKVRAKSLEFGRYGQTSGQIPTMECFPTKDRKLYLFPGYNPCI